VKSRHIVNGQVMKVDADGGLLVRGKFDANGACDPGGGPDVTCASVDMTFPRAARPLLVVGGSWQQGTPDGTVLGHCFLYADDTLVCRRLMTRRRRRTSKALLAAALTAAP
jgi:hypothetical protein